MSGTPRERSAMRVHRARLAGAALIGLAAVAWWTGKLTGIW